MARSAQIRDDFPHNNHESDSDTSSSDDSNSSDEGSDGDGEGDGPASSDSIAQSAIASLAAHNMKKAPPSASFSNFVPTFGGRPSKGLDKFEDDEFMALTPEKILEDLRNTHSKKSNSGKTFKAAHALSLRRKLASYHRHGIPNAMRAKNKGRRGSAFDASSKFTRRESKRIGLDCYDTKMLQGFAEQSGLAVARNLLEISDSEEVSACERANERSCVQLILVGILFNPQSCRTTKSKRMRTRRSTTTATTCTASTRACTNLSWPAGRGARGRCT